MNDRRRNKIITFRVTDEEYTKIKNAALTGGLKGEVSSEQYERLVASQDPHTGEQLIRSVSARETADEDGKKTNHQHARD